MSESTPPLLRGIGTVLVLIAAIVAIRIANVQDASVSLLPPGVKHIEGDASAQIREPHTDGEEDLVEEVLENRWFSWISVVGTAVIAASFFAESYLRWKRAGTRSHVESNETR